MPTVVVMMTSFLWPCPRYATHSRCSCTDNDRDVDVVYLVVIPALCHTQLLPLVTYDGDDAYVVPFTLVSLLKNAAIVR